MATNWNVHWKKKKSDKLSFPPSPLSLSLHWEGPELHSSIQYHITTAAATAVILLLLLTPILLPRCCRIQISVNHSCNLTVLYSIAQSSCEKMSSTFITLFYVLEALPLRRDFQRREIEILNVPLQNERLPLHFLDLDSITLALSYPPSFVLF